MIPKKLGWILMAAPVAAWLIGLAVVWWITGDDKRQYRQDLRIFELETRLHSPTVYITANGKKYHTESHDVGATTEISHYQAQLRGLTKCLNCDAPKQRKYPKKPEPPEAQTKPWRALWWSAGFIPMIWAILFLLLPIEVREYYMRWR